MLTELTYSLFIVEQKPQSGVEAFPISEIPQELCARRAEHQNSPLHKTS